MVFLSLCLGAQVTFTNVASQYGIDYVYDGIVTDGSGISFMDLNDDLWDDISFGTHFGLLPSIYIHQGDSLVLSDITGLQDELNGSRSMAWVDYDNDGDKDLCITNVNSVVGTTPEGVQKLYNRVNDSTLVDVTFSAGWNLEPFPSYCQTWADYDNDGWLDCYLSQRKGLNNSTNYLYHNNGDGTFTELATQLGVDDTQGMTYQALFFDYDLDGDVDLFTANDKWQTRNRFFENNGDGTFTDITEQSGLGAYMEGMGIAMGDFDGNGFIDMYVANAGSQNPDDDSGCKLYLNHGDGTWEEVAAALGIDVNYTVWGVNMFDMDNDMDLDVFCVAGGSPPADAQQIFINNGGAMERVYDPDFTEVSGASFGTAIGDLDDNGLYDILVANNTQGAHQLWLNDTQTENHFIKFNLEGTISNKDAIGSLVEIWTQGIKQIRFTICGNSYGSQDSDTYIVGLAENEVVDSIVVKWPSGYENVLFDLPADVRYDILEDTSQYAISCIPQVEIEYVIEGTSIEAFVTDPLSTETYTWHVDSVIDYTGVSIVHDFGNEGAYEICLTTDNGCSSAEMCFEIEVICPIPQAEFSAVSENYTGIFENLTIGADSLVWNFGDGSFSTSIEPTHEYDFIGIYEVTLIAFNSCGVDSTTQSVEIICDLPMAGFFAEVDSFLVLLEDMSNAADSIYWDFGDGQYSSGAIMLYEYAEEGSYTLCQVAYNTCGVDSACVTLTIDDGISGIQEHSQSLLSLYPNPADEMLYIPIERNTIHKDVEIIILDHWGKELRRLQVYLDHGQASLLIDVSSLASGVYVLQRIFDSQISVGRFLKN